MDVVGSSRRSSADSLRPRRGSGRGDPPGPDAAGVGRLAGSDGGAGGPRGAARAARAARARPRRANRSASPSGARGRPPLGRRRPRVPRPGRGWRDRAQAALRRESAAPSRSTMRPDGPGGNSPPVRVPRSADGVARSVAAMTAAAHAERAEDPRRRRPDDVDALDDGGRRSRAQPARGRPRGGRAGPRRRTRTEPSASFATQPVSSRSHGLAPGEIAVPDALDHAADRRVDAGRAPRSDGSGRSRGPRASRPAQARARRGRAPARRSRRGASRRARAAPSARRGRAGRERRGAARSISSRRSGSWIERVGRRTWREARSRATSIQIVDDGLGRAPTLRRAAVPWHGASGSTASGRRPPMRRPPSGAGRRAGGSVVGPAAGRHGRRPARPLAVGRAAASAGRPPRASAARGVEGARPASSRAGMAARIAASRAAGPASSRSRSVRASSPRIRSASGARA